jgi:hypothetical protein
VAVTAQILFAERCGAIARDPYQRSFMAFFHNKEHFGKKHVPHITLSISSVCVGNFNAASEGK